MMSSSHSRSGPSAPRDGPRGRSMPRSPGLVLLAIALLTVACVTPRNAAHGSSPRRSRPVNTTQPPDSTVAAAKLSSLIQDVRRSAGHRYAMQDNVGNSMDGLTIISRPHGGYLGVYHYEQAGTFTTALATSTDLLNWNRRVELSADASQPDIVALSDGGYLLAVEADSDGISDPASRWLRFLHYPDGPALLTATPDGTFDAPHTLGGRYAGAEGTPDIEAATLTPDISHSVIQISFHYLDGKLDREGRGTLLDFSKWSTSPDTALDQALSRAGAHGKHGDRDVLSYQGAELTLVEAQKQLDGPWNLYLFDRHDSTTWRLNITTHHGSHAFGNPSLGTLPGPGATTVLVVTTFIPQPGDAAGEAGELLYYLRL
jgi:hypothetical protein